MSDKEWFGEVKWCDEDLKCALEFRGIPATKENVKMLRDEISERWFKDYLIQYGFEYLYAKIDEIEFDQ